MHEKQEILFDQFEYVREQFRYYLDTSNGTLQRFTALYDGGMKLMDIMKSVTYASNRHLSKALKIDGISADFISKLIETLKKYTVDQMLDKVQEGRCDSFESLYASMKYRPKLKQSYKNSPAEIAIGIINVLSDGLKSIRTYESSYDELEKIVGHIKAHLPSIWTASVTRDQWFFSMQPCCGCGKDVDLADYPDGYELIDFSHGNDSFIAPMCDDCKGTKQPNKDRLVVMYVRYGKRMEEELINSVVNFATDEINSMDDGIIFGDEDL